MRGKGQGGKHLIAAATPSGITLDPPAPLYCREFPRAGASPGATADPQHPCDFSRNGIYHQRLKSQVFRLQTKTVFIHSEENCLHRSYCFWLSADLGFTSGLYYLSATTGNFLFFFLTMNFWMMQWKKQPSGKRAGLPNHHDTPQPDCAESGGSAALGPLTLHKVHLGNKSPSTI